VDLVQQVSDAVGVDREKAESVLGSFFTSIRMAVDPATFGKVIQALPDAEEWMLALTFAGGRTGEIIALAGPEGLRRQLQVIGLDDAQIAKAGATVGEALRQLLPKDATEKIIKRISLLK
jgi:hypothetical protein